MKDTARWQKAGDESADRNAGTRTLEPTALPEFSFRDETMRRTRNVEVDVRLFPSPRGDEAREFERLAEVARDLARRVGDVDRERADALREAHEASAALTVTERRRAAGEDVDAAAIRKGEKALSAARAKAAEPWAERAAGAREAARQADHAATGFAAENYERLAIEIAEDARAVAAGMDDAMRELLHARTAYADVSQRAIGLIAAAGSRSRPGVVPWSKTDGLAAEIDRLLMEGGEVAPEPPATITPHNAVVA